MLFGKKSARKPPTNPAPGQVVPFGQGPPPCPWTQVSETHYIYDGFRVIQERDGLNNPQVSYTRGTDLSGSLEGAGGIGGLLARSSGYSSGNWTSHAYYHADGNGNITAMLDGNGNLVADYRYDAFGNTLGKSGTLCDANLYRFSSKEIHLESGMYYFGFRFYDPNLQRWINRDPVQERGDVNLYAYAGNNPPSFSDPFGFDVWIEGPSGSEPTGHQSINVGDPNGRYVSQSWGITGLSPFGHVYPDENLGGEIQKYAKTTPQQDRIMLGDLASDLNSDPGSKLYGLKTCRTYSQDKFDQYKKNFHLTQSPPPKRKRASRALFRVFTWPTTGPFSSTTSSSGTSTSR